MVWGSSTSILSMISKLTRATEPVALSITRSIVAFTSSASASRP